MKLLCRRGRGGRIRDSQNVAARHLVIVIVLLAVVVVGLPRPWKL
jgi:hypothetical protein